MQVDELTNAPMGDPDDQNEAVEQEATTETEQEAPVIDFMNNPALQAYIQEQVQEGIKKALKGKPPKANTADLTEQEYNNFEKMTYRERLNLFKSNPQTYYKLSKGVK